MYSRIHIILLAEPDSRIEESLKAEDCKQIVGFLPDMCDVGAAQRRTRWSEDATDWFPFTARMFVSATLWTLVSFERRFEDQIHAQDQK